MSSHEKTLLSVLETISSGLKGGCFDVEISPLSLQGTSI